MKNYLYGINSILSRLNKESPDILQLFLLRSRQDKRLQQCLSLAKQKKISVMFVDRNKLDDMVHHSNHQGVVAEVATAKSLNENDLEDILDKLHEAPFLLILDGVQDPHNLGACLRTANAAGVHAVIAPKDNSASITPTVSKVASGAAETTPFIQVTNLVRTIERLKERGIWIIGSAGEATESLLNTKLTPPIAIVMGAEGKGMRRLTKEHCDQLLMIPMKGDVESLNVSVATGIFLFACHR